jgi:hypothetical protein
MMDRKQKEALIIALAEKGETYRDITKKAGVSPNTIKAVLNRAGLDESTSIHSRAFELFSEGKTPLQVAIKLNLEAETAIQYHQQYYMLLGCTEFTKVYTQIRANPWPFVNLVKIAQNTEISEDEVEEILKIANGCLPRVKLEHDRINAELNSLKAETSNATYIYQGFCDRNTKLKNREDELRKVISKLEAKKAELQKSLSQPEFHGNDTDNTNVILKARLEEIMSTSDVSIQRSKMQNENNGVHLYPSQVEPSSRTLIFDTKDLF